MRCAICGKEVEGFGNNPYPIRLGEDDRCCNDCDGIVVMARIALLGRSSEDVDAFAEKFNQMSYDELVNIFYRK